MKNNQYDSIFIAAYVVLSVVAVIVGGLGIIK